VRELLEARLRLRSEHRLFLVGQLELVRLFLRERLAGELLGRGFRFIGLRL
jgi:hypothetical protein